MMTKAWDWIAANITMVGIGCLSNGIFLALIVVKRHSLPVTATLLASLSANGIFTCILHAVTAYESISHDTVGAALLAIMFCLYLITDLHLAAAAFERHVLIVYPFRHPKLFTKVRIWAAIVLCYLIPSFVCAMVFLVTEMLLFGTIVRHLDRAQSCQFYAVHFSVTLSPGILVILFYIRIYFTAIRQRRKIANVLNQRSNVSFRPVIILLITATYSFLLWLLACAFILTMCHVHGTSHIIGKVATMLPILHLSLHPIVYGFGDSILRKAFIRCFCRIRDHPIQPVCKS